MQSVWQNKLNIMKKICCLLVFVLCCSVFGSYDKKEVQDTPVNEIVEQPEDTSKEEDTQNDTTENPPEDTQSDAPAENVTETPSDIEQPEVPVENGTDPSIDGGQDAPAQTPPENTVDEQQTPVEDEIVTTVKSKATEAINSVVTSDMTEYQKLKIVYEWLFYHYKYRTVAVDVSGGYTDELTYELASYYFKYHKGSCEHYAAAQKVLFEQLGYEVKYVEGQRLSSEDSTYGEHVWVMVKINDNWYHVDGLYSGNHTYDILTVFCVPDTAIEGSHKWMKEMYPECTAPRYAE